MNRLIAALLLSTGLPVMANAAILDNGTIQLGVNAGGQLNTYNDDLSDYIGLQDKRTGHEATSPGCPCEGWGVGYADAGGSAIDSGFANENFGGLNNLSQVSFVSDATSATSVTQLGSALRITHAFAPASETSNLFRVTVTVENISGADIADLRYTRAMDWDVEPTAFSEFVTIGGTAAASNVLYADDNGFISADPFGGRSAIVASGDQVDSGPSDHGAAFDFGFGTLLAGGSQSFEIFYGAALDETSALASLAAVGAEVYSFGQSVNDQNGGTTGYSTFIFGFAGVGGDPVAPVPVPASALLLLGGLGLLGGLRSRRKSA